MSERRRSVQLRRRESGQVLTIVALSLVALLGFVALAIDVGRMMETRRQLQNAADAAAHAGVQVLPDDPSDARSAASDWAAKNGVGAGDSVFISIYNTNADNDTIHVTVTRPVPYTFARVLGLTSADVSASATAIVSSVKGGKGIMPFGLIDLDPGSPGFGYTYNTQVTIKQVPGNQGFQSPGNYGPLALDASGGKTLREVIAAGGSQTQYKVGDQVGTQTGQQTGNLNQGFDDWAASHNDAMGSSCDDWDASHTYVNGKLQVVAKCRYRVVLVPIIDTWPNGGSADVTILGFAQMYIAGFSNGNGKAISAIFLDDSYAHPDIILGAYDGYGTRVARLTE